MTLRFAPFLFLAAVLSGAQDRIAAPLDSTRTVVLKGHLHPLAQARFDQGRVDPAMPISYATLHVKPAPGLEAFLADQQNPQSDNYRRWLTPEQFGERFGVSDNDLAKITAWLKAQGFQVHDVARGRHWITFSGTAEQAGRAFHTEIHRYLVDSKSHFANATEPSIPAALAGVVDAVRGLNDFRLESQARVAPVGPSYNTASGRALAPDDFSTIYNLTPLYGQGIDGTGQSIAIIGQTGIHLSDIQSFRSRFNLPANDPQVKLFGANPGINQTDLQEANLDIEWSGAVAPNAAIIYVYSSDVITAAQYAIDGNVAPVMSLSYGGCEAYDSNGIRGLAQQANALGITWFASSGDQGATTCDGRDASPVATQGPTVTSPASLPEITAVGGSEFTDMGGTYWASTATKNGASALSYVPERAWNDYVAGGSIAFYGTGGGASALFDKPAWQTGPGVPNDKQRDLPDISLPASGTVPYLGILNGGLVGYSGTSASSPSFAGIAALLNQYLKTSGLGNINPALYRLAQSTQDVFHDISTGDNKAACLQGSPACTNGLVGFNAGTAYDLATGLGSVDAYRLATEWDKNGTTATNLTLSPGNLNLSDTVQLSAAVTGSGVPPTGTVTFLVNDTAIGSAPLSGSSANLAVSALVLAAGGNTVRALYSGDAVYSPSAGAARFTVNTTPGAALVVPFVTPNPVYETAPFAQWDYTVGVMEKNGVAATVTAFTIDGSNALPLFIVTKLPANGMLSTALASSNLTVPANRVFSFGGTDANGNKWSQQLIVPFLAPLGTQTSPAISLTSPTTTVQQNPKADPSCQWLQQLTVQELSGYPVSLTTLTAGTTALSSQLQSVFGTTRLAPYGMLSGTVCFTGSTAPTAKAVQIGGSVTLVPGSQPLGVSSSVPTSFTAASAAPATMASGVPSLSLSIPAGQGLATSLVPLTFTGGTPKWTASVSPANRTSSWLTIGTITSTGPSSITIQASSAGLSPGAYRALISIQAVDAVPQVINVPVTLLVGGSSTTQIGGVGNAWSGGVTAAPGAILSVYGTQLANTTASAPRLPLPLTMGGVSATVNGFPAPLYYISSGQINLQVPYEAGSGPALLSINNNGQVASFPFNVAAAAPGVDNLFVDNSTGAPVTSAQAGSSQVLLLFLTGDGDVTPTLATGATPAASTATSALPHSRMPFAMTIGGVPVTGNTNLLFSGIPSGLAGTTQVDFRVPAAVPAGNQPVVVTIGGVPAQTIFLNVTTAASQ